MQAEHDRKIREKGKSNQIFQCGVVVNFPKSVFAGEQFERWIKMKETALETEEANNKLLQKRVEEAKIEVSELRKELEQQQEGAKSLESLLVDAHDESRSGH